MPNSSYYRLHAEELRAKRRLYHERNKERDNLAKRLHYAAHKAEYHARHRKWVKKNRKKASGYSSRWRLANQERVARYKKPVFYSFDAVESSLDLSTNITPFMILDLKERFLAG